MSEQRERALGDPEIAVEILRLRVAELEQAATEIERLRLAVRELLDGVNARCPDKNPREWTCPHMAALDRLVPPVDDERHDATDSVLRLSRFRKLENGIAQACRRGRMFAVRGSRTGRNSR